MTDTTLENAPRVGTRILVRFPRPHPPQQLDEAWYPGVVIRAYVRDRVEYLSAAVFVDFLAHPPQPQGGLYPGAQGPVLTCMDLESPSSLASLRGAVTGSSEYTAAMRRPRSLSRAQFFAVLREIGIKREELTQCVEQPETLEEKQAALEAFKDTIRRAFKQRLFEVHPDRNPEDTQAEELCKALNSVQSVFMQCVDTLHVAPPRPKREIIHRVQHKWHNPFDGWANTTSATTSTNFNIPWQRVVWVRR
jgi:hypothetical protein